MPAEETAEERIGPYRLASRLGEGGMGVVYRGVDATGHDVAVKVLRPELAEDEGFRLRLQREVDTMRRIQSRRVAQVLDADLHAERPYIVTRYVSGHALDETVRATGALTGRLLEQVATGLAEALVAIHAAGVVHRDLKPNNVMLVNGEPIVIDFGIAHAADSTRLTQTGMIVGTPGYLAPEVIDGHRAGPEADVYAWGATVAFAATGRSPFGAGTMEAVLARIIRGQADLSGLPSPIGDGVAATLSRDPGRRPTAEQLADWLRGPGTTRPPSTPIPATRRLTPPPVGMGMPGPVRQPSTPVPMNPVPMSPTPMSPVPMSPTPMSPVPMSPVPMSPMPMSAVPRSPAGPYPLEPSGRIDLGWYKLTGYLFILIAVGLAVELPALAGPVVVAACWYLRAGDVAVRSRLVPVRDWRDLLLAPLRWPGGMAKSFGGTLGTLVYSCLAYLVVIVALLAVPNGAFSNATVDSWALGAAAYVLLAGVGVAAPRRQVVRLLSATAQQRQTAVMVGLGATAVLLLTAVVVSSDVPHWAPLTDPDTALTHLREQLQQGVDKLKRGGK